jgi:hypothetical protein
MNIFFDVDNTILGDDGSLRRHADIVFARLVSDGHRLYVWSGVGLRWAVVQAHGLAPYVTECFEKPTTRHRERLEPLGVTLVPDFVVDDFADIVSVFGGVAVKPYHRAANGDDELQTVYDVIVAVAQGSPAHPRYVAADIQAALDAAD